jgi:hypothetical protein
VVRKWSYIIPSKNLNNSFLTKLITTTNKVYKTFRFKIFRKNTRFKKYNLTNNTSFVRKYPIYRKRRSNWKFYVVLSSEWVKLMFLSRQLINFVQSKSIFTNSAHLSYKINFTHNLNELVGLGSYSLSFTKINTQLITKFNRIGKVYNNIASSSSLENLTKLNNSGFLLSYLVFSSDKYPLNSDIKNYINYSKIKYSFLSLRNIIFSLLLKTSFTLYKLIKLNTLLLIK